MADKSVKHTDHAAETSVNYKGLVESANSIILIMNPKGEITFINRFGKRFFGFDSGEILGRPIWESIAPENVFDAGVLGALQAILKNPGKFPNHTNENVKKDGTRVWITWSNQGLFDDAGQLVEILSVGNDVTCQKGVEDELKAHKADLAGKFRKRTLELSEVSRHLLWSQRRLMLVDTISTCIISNKGLAFTVEKVLERLTTVVHAVGAAYLPVEPGAVLLTFDCSSAPGGMPDLKGQTIGTDDASPLFKTLIRKFKPCMFRAGPRVSDHRGLGRLMERSGIASGIVAPVHRDNRLMGLIFLYSNAVRSFDCEETALMAQVSESMALGLNHLMDRARILAQEKFLEDIIGGVDIGIFVLTVAVSGTVVFESVNKTYRSLWRLGKSRMVGRTLSGIGALIGPLAQERLRASVATCIESKKSVRFLEEAAQDTGESRFWLTRLNPVLDGDNRVFRIIGASTDITDQKLAQKALVRNQARLEEAQRMAKLGDCERLVGSLHMSCSAQLLNIFGLNPGQAPGYDEFLELVHPEDREYVDEQIRKAIGNQCAYEIEYRIVRGDGVEKIVNEVGEVIPDEDGKHLKVACIIQDITEQKKVRDEIELAGKVFDNAVEGVMVTDPNGIIQFVNPGFTTITGYTEKEALGQTPQMLKSDRHGAEFYKTLWDTLLERGHWSGEIWNRRKSGEAYPEHLSITAITNSRGQTMRYMSVFSDLSDIRAREEQLKFQANYDALTGLPNRSLLQDRIEMSIRRARRDNRGLALIFLDMDDFKHVNDMLGHAKGDLLLQQFAGRLLECIRSQDTVARYGGDEFIILIPDTCDAKVIIRVIERIQDALKHAFVVDGKRFFMGVSIGVTVGPDDGREPDVLIANADMAMYRSKEAGKGGYAFFTPELNRQVARRVELEMDLRMGLSRQEFLLYFQPKFDIRTQKICGAEALIRWNHPEKGMVSPLEFIPLAEETGMINPMGEWILEEACARAKAWAKVVGRILPIAVNISPRQVRDQNLPGLVDDVLSRYNLPAQSLELEITESAVMGNLEKAKSMLTELSSMGISISLDDFGTGFSSLSYLRQLPISSLKIDKSFVDDIPEDPDSNTMVTTIITMARHLKLVTVAEGVETASQLDFLRENGCCQIQGYYFSPPLPQDEFLELLVRQADAWKKGTD